MNTLAPFAILYVAIAILTLWVAIATSARAQDPKQEAEDLANSLLPTVHDAASQPPTTDSVPGFSTDNPAETSYYSSPASIGGDAALAASRNEAPLAVQTSIASRPAISDEEVVSTTASGFAAQYGAAAALPEFTGTYGACASSLVNGSVVATCGDDTYCISGDCETVSRQQDSDLPDAAAGLQMLASLSAEFDETTLTVFGGGDYRCRTAFGGALNCCGDEGFISDIIGCPTEAQMLNEKLPEGLCSYIGKYCSRRVLGVCLARKRAYCCFDSKLSRIINEQGRAQIAKSWGSPRRPSCEGFGVPEFQALDLAAMDLSEYYADATETVNPPSEGDALPGLEAQIAAYYQ